MSDREFWMVLLIHAAFAVAVGMEFGWNFGLMALTACSMLERFQNKFGGRR